MVNGEQHPNERLLDYSQLEPFIDQEKGGVLETLDQDESGTVSDGELRSFMTRLRENGVPGADLDVRIVVLNPTHDFTDRGEKARDCTLCHSRDAKFYSRHVLELPEKDGGFRTIPVEKGILVRRGEQPFGEDLYLLGEYKIRRDDLGELIAAVSRIGFKWLDLAGVFIISFSAVAVCFHATLLLGTRKLRSKSEATSVAEPLPAAIRGWHWLHGLCVILLILTGVQLRLPDTAPLFATLLNAVNLHNLSGIILIVDYVFWITYHMWKKTFRIRFLVSSDNPLKDLMESLRYYAYSIFFGNGQPNGRSSSSNLDPVERLFFLVMMVILLPLQMLSGILLYDVHAMMPVIRMLGGLRVVDAVHVLGAYLLVSSLVFHVYFHTLKKYSRPAFRLSASRNA
jgi:thiosulfate reductase cytochrome b subunit